MGGDEAAGQAVNIERRLIRNNRGTVSQFIRVPP